MIWYLLYPLSLSIEAHFSIVVRMNNALDGQVIAFYQQTNLINGFKYFYIFLHSLVQLWYDRKHKRVMNFFPVTFYSEYFFIICNNKILLQIYHTYILCFQYALYLIMLIPQIMYTARPILIISHTHFLVVLLTNT